MHHHKPSVMWKEWYANFKVKVTLMAHNIKMWLFLPYLLNCWSFCNQISPDVTSSSWLGSKHQSPKIATKLSIMVHHHESECLVRRLVCCVHCQGHSEGSKLYWMFVSPLFSVPLIPLQLNVVLGGVMYTELCSIHAKSSCTDPKYKFSLNIKMTRSILGQIDPKKNLCFFVCFVLFIYSFIHLWFDLLSVRSFQVCSSMTRTTEMVSPCSGMSCYICIYIYMYKFVFIIYCVISKDLTVNGNHFI